MTDIRWIVGTNSWTRPGLRPSAQYTNLIGMTRPTIVISANRGFALTRSRAPLMNQLLDRDWRVVVATRKDRESRRLRELGVQVEEVKFARGGLASRADLKALLHLGRLYRAYRPDLIHNFNAKPIILGTLAAIGIRPPPTIVNTLTGLGHSLSGGLSSLLARRGYRWSGRRAAVTIFQNYEDERLFLDSGYTAPRRSRLIIGSGVDVGRFSPLPKEGEPAGVVMVTRLLRQKGVDDYLEAARLVRRQRPGIRFALAGEWEDDHPDTIPRSLVRKSVEAGDVEFLGYVDDLEKILPRYALFAFPSYYREGVPRVLLEAAACGLPLVAADAAGAREVVLAGQTGWLVPPRDPEALATRILRAFADPGALALVGQNARRLAIERFDVHEITVRYLEVYEDIGFDMGEISDE